jgi:hypothetical protein
VETLSARNSGLTEQLKQRELKLKEGAEERRELKETNLELNDAITRLSEQIHKTERERDMNMKWRSIANDRGADVNRLAQENANLRNQGYVSFSLSLSLCLFLCLFTFQALICVHVINVAHLIFLGYLYF